MLGQIDYTSRDYESLRLDLIDAVKTKIPEWDANDPSDFALALVESFAHMGDIMSYYMDRVANESLIATATQKSTLLNFAEIAGYKPSGPVPARVALTFTNNTGVPLNLPVGTQVVASLDYGPFTEAYFETIKSVSQLANGDSITVNAVEGKTGNSNVPSGIDENFKVRPISLGTSNGYAYQEFSTPVAGIVDNSISVYVGQGSGFVQWKYVSNIVESGPFDKVFTTKMNTNGTVSIVFGDGINGKVPTQSEPISAIYRSSVGTAGNVAAGKINSVSFIPGVGLDPSGIVVSNVSAAVGGSDGEPLHLLRKNIQKALSARNRAVTLKDYEKLAVIVSGVGRAQAVADVYTSVTLYIQPYNDGSTTPGLVSGVPTDSWNSLAASVTTFFDGRMPVNASVTVSPPTYVDIDLTMDVTIKDSFRQRDVRIAIAQILLDSTNGLFSYNNYGFGDTVSMSEIIATVMSVPGVSRVELTTLDLHGGSAVSNLTMAPNEIPILQAANLGIPITGGIA